MHHFCHQSSAWQLNEKTILTLILLNGRRTCLEEESHRSRAVSRRRFSSRESPTIGGGSTLSARPKRRSKSGCQAGFFAVLWFFICVYYKGKQGWTDTLPCFILIAWKWFCTAEVRFGAISSSTITWIFQRLFVWLVLVKVYLCLGQAVVPILALAQVCLRHQLVPLLHVQVFVSHLIKTSPSAAEWHLWEPPTFMTGVQLYNN